MQCLRNLFSCSPSQPYLTDPDVAESFVAACREGSLSEVQKHLANTDPEGIVRFGALESGFLAACAFGQVDVVSLLLSLAGKRTVRAVEGYQQCTSSLRFTALHRKLVPKEYHNKLMRAAPTNSPPYANREFIFGHSRAGDISGVMTQLLALGGDREVPPLELQVAFKHACECSDVRMIRILLSLSGPRQLPLRLQQQKFIDAAQEQNEIVVLALLRNAGSTVHAVSIFISICLNSAFSLGRAYSLGLDQLLRQLQTDLFYCSSQHGYDEFTQLQQGALMTALAGRSHFRPQLDEYGFDTPAAGAARLRQRVEACLDALATCLALPNCLYRDTFCVVMQECMCRGAAVPVLNQQCVLCRLRGVLMRLRWHGYEVPLPGGRHTHYGRGTVLLRRKQYKNSRV